MLNSKIANVTEFECFWRLASIHSNKDDKQIKNRESAAVPTRFSTYINYANITSHRDLTSASCGVNSGWVVPNTSDK